MIINIIYYVLEAEGVATSFFFCMAHSVSRELFSC